ncbi:MAG: iron chelate uptake ABC transporter family permease subunit [Planctomycetota bacterium]
MYNLNWSESELVKLRIFRIFGVFFCGAGICLAGFILQQMFRNPIVDIYILGNASICILAQIISLSFWSYPLSYIMSYLLSFILTILLMFSMYKFSHHGAYFDLVKLLMLSFAVNIFIWGVINFVIYKVVRLNNINIYQLLAGTVEGIYINEILMIVTGSILSFFYLYEQLDKIHILSIGEEFAITTGVDIEKLKLEVFIIISLLSTVVTVTIGIVPFLGIIVPHFIRLFIKSNIYTRFYLVLLAGAFLSLVADTISMLTVNYFNLPVFIIMNFLAFPFFVYLVIKK